MAAIKIGLTAGFILIGIPLLTRWLRPGEGVLVTASPAQDLSRGEYLMPSAVYTAQPALVQTWSQATLWVGQTSRRNLWFIVKTTVPLMLLAGLLGSALITFLPFESLAYILPRTGRLMTLLGMGAVALIGISLPVPMAFDTIVTAILLQAGLPVTYAIVLLFTLGIFSIYPFFMVWQAMGRCMAMSLLFGLAGLGIVAGVVGHRYAQWDLQRQQRVVFAAFGQASALEGPKVLRVGGGTHEVIPDHELVASLRSAALIPQPVTIATVEGITVARVALQTPVAKPGTLFSRFEGDQFGLDEPSTFSILRFIEPFAEFGVSLPGTSIMTGGSISS